MRNLWLLCILAVVMGCGSHSLFSTVRTTRSQNHTNGGGSTPKMGRVKTVGWEWGTSLPDSGSASGASATVSRVTAPVRSGNGALKCAAGNNGLAYGTTSVVAADTTREMFYRGYIWFESLPDAVAARNFLMSADDSGAGTLVRVEMTSTGDLYLRNVVTSADIAGPFAAGLATGQWYKFELRVKSESGVGAGDGEAEFRIDNASVLSGTSLTLGAGFSSGMRIGFVGIPTDGGGTKVCYIDDAGANNTSGTVQNSWLGDGKDVVLFPLSDNAVGTGWTDGDGAGTLFGSVDNVPPVGNATPADGTQIRNAASTTTGNYDTNCQSYDSAGIGPTDTIVFAQGVCVHAEEISTGTKAGALQIVSNPAQSGEDAFNYGNDAGAMGNYPVVWAQRLGTVQYNPSVTLGTQPVLRVGKRTATTRAVDVCLMGIIVEYTPGPVIAQLSQHKRAVQISDAYRE